MNSQIYRDGIFHLGLRIRITIKKINYLVYLYLDIDWPENEDPEIDNADIEKLQDDLTAVQKLLSYC